MRVLRVYHGSRDPAHRLRERALVAAGAQVTLVVPDRWPGSHLGVVTEPGVEIVTLPVVRPGDVNRHRYADGDGLRRAIAAARPDVLDLHEEPISEVTRQVLTGAPARLPVAMYTAQNLDKRFPPPYSWRERQALGRVDALYPCARQAASVARGKGFAGLVRVLPLGYDPEVLRPGDQALEDGELVLGLVGRLVPEKGLLDAVEVTARLHRARPTRLLVVGSGPDLPLARDRAAQLGIGDRLEVVEWVDRHRLAECYRRMHVVLLPSRATARWVEQFGRVIVEAHASGAVVAGYATGSIPEVSAGAAVLVSDGDVAALGVGVQRLIDDPQQWRRRRELGLRLSATRTWEAVAVQQLAVYAELLTRGAGDRRTVRLTTAADRAHAVAEFGPPATAGVQRRPFAIPVLRDHPPVSEALGRVLDRATATAAALGHIGPSGHGGA